MSSADARAALARDRRLACDRFASGRCSDDGATRADRERRGDIRGGRDRRAGTLACPARPDRDEHGRADHDEAARAAADRTRPSSRSSSPASTRPSRSRSWSRRRCGRWRARASTARSSSPTTARPTAPPSSPRRPARASCTSRARATAPPTSPASTPPRGTYILMGDADDTYDFTQLGRFLGPLHDGADMVIGNRMSGLQPGSMPWLHRYVGNPVLTGHPQPLLPHRRQRRPLRDARLPPRPAAAPRPAHDRDGVRLRAGDPLLEGSASTSARSTSSTTRARASRSSPRSRTAGATCASCSSTARPGCS